MASVLENMNAEADSKYGTKAFDWDFHAQSYAATVERITRPPCEELVRWVHKTSPLSARNVRVLDDGAGTGVLSTIVKEHFPEAPIIATDISAGMIAVVDRIAKERGWKDYVGRVLDAQNLEGLDDESCSHVFSTFMIGSTPDPSKVAKELFRVTRHGGVVGLATWIDPTAWSPIMESAVRKLIPSYRAPSIIHPSFSSAPATKASLEKAGFAGVEVRVMDDPWNWVSTEDVLKYVFEDKNPIVGILTKGLEDRMEEIRMAFKRVVEEEYEGGKAITEHAILAVGRKA